jgi:aryl-alcohol dehydrogenase-like predicted oxidoreductase
MKMALHPLGKSGIRITPVGLGCWQFSQGQGWNKYWPALPEAEIEGIVAAAIDGGINWFDTAEAYGNGASERQLARVLQKAGHPPGAFVIATKWMPIFRRASHIGETIEVRRANLAPYPIDLYQIHNPASFSSVAAQMKAMAKLVGEGRIKSVGVSNFGAKRMIEAHRVLAEAGLPLVSNQVHYSLLKRKIEANGVLEAARERGITIIAYSPLDQGVLTGRYHDHPELVGKIAGARKWRGFYKAKFLGKSRPVIEALKEIGARRAATPAQIALNWLFSAHGESVVVIPGATKTAQAAANAAAMAFALTKDEIDHLDRVSRPFRGD